MNFKICLKKYSDIISQNSTNLSDQFIDYRYVGSEEFLKEYFVNDYLEGALVLNQNNGSLFDLSKWDLVDQLLCYLVNALHEVFLDSRKMSVFFYPDQPIEVSVTKLHSVVLFADSFGSKVTLNDWDLLNLLNEIEAFFNYFREMTDSNSLVSYEIMIKEILSSVRFSS